MVFVRRWNAHSGKGVGVPMKVHDGAPIESELRNTITCAVISTDGKFIVTGFSAEIRRWNALI